MSLSSVIRVSHWLMADESMRQSMKSLSMRLSLKDVSRRLLPWIGMVSIASS